MAKIDISVTAKTVNAEYSSQHGMIDVTITDVELSDLISDVSEDDLILHEIGADVIADWIINNNKLESVLDNFAPRDVADWLEKAGWKLEEL